MNIQNYYRLATKTKNSSGIAKQTWHFFLHLRWHYQIFILSGGFLLGGLLSDNLHARWFIIQFFNVHLLLFGGATAYNSYWDKDEGPIGGLKKPPKMVPWMWMASLLLQMIGLLLALPLGSMYIGTYALSMLLFWLYSTPHVRWKGHPVKSLFAIGISTGFNGVLLGYLAAEGRTIPIFILIAALGVTCMLLSLYPLSQIYQRNEDARRGDNTFTITYGITAVFLFFDIMFFSGLVLITIAILWHYMIVGLLFGVVGLITGFIVRTYLRNLTIHKDEYEKVMRIKYGTSIAFGLFLLIFLILKHVEIDQLSSISELFFNQ